MTGEEFIARFEADAIPEDSFHHADHVRLAFAYLLQFPSSRFPSPQFPSPQVPSPRFPPLEALERFCLALKRFAAARGQAQRYHETITHAYFFLIRERMERCGPMDWDEFARRNPDLLVWKGGLLSRYYNDETLKSDLARRIFVMPDRSNLGV